MFYNCAVCAPAAKRYFFKVPVLIPFVCIFSRRLVLKIATYCLIIMVGWWLRIQYIGVDA